MINRVELKKKAREDLIGKYGDAIGIVLLLFAISFIVGIATGLIRELFSLNKTNYQILDSICSFILSGLFTLGYTSFFLKISRNEETEINELWSKTNLFVPYIIITILISLFTTLWALLLIIPGIIVGISCSMSYYILLDNPEMKAIKAIRESQRIMMGHKMDFFILELSFLGWAVLGIFTLGILWLWLIPYMNVTNANFYNTIKEL